MCVRFVFTFHRCMHDGVRFDGQSFGRKRGNRAPGPVLAPNILLARREYSTGAVVLRTTPRRIPCTVAPPPHTHARTHAYVCAPHGEPACPAPPPLLLLTCTVENTNTKHPLLQRTMPFACVNRCICMRQDSEFSSQPA